MDRIEKSNLSRQFLFRSKDINHFKSSTAAGAVQEMNPSMNITALQEKVAPDTENIFGDKFYDKLFYHGKFPEYNQMRRISALSYRNDYNLADYDN